MIQLFISLLLAHLLGDFVFQPSSWVTHKKLFKIKSGYLYLHILIHFLLLVLLLKFDFSFYLGIILIVLSHYLIDLLKLYLHNRFRESLLFLIDQVLHISVLFFVANYYRPFSFQYAVLLNPENLLLVIAIVILSSFSAIAMRLIMSYWPLEDLQADESLKNAGKYIGILERLLIFVFIILNQWSAIGFLITAKSVFRFSDLSRSKDRKLTEYILVGTMLSFSIAIVVGLVFKSFIPL